MFPSATVKKDAIPRKISAISTDTPSASIPNKGTDYWDRSLIWVISG